MLVFIFARGKALLFTYKISISALKITVGIKILWLIALWIFLNTIKKKCRWNVMKMLYTLGQKIYVNLFWTDFWLDWMRVSWTDDCHSLTVQHEMLSTAHHNDKYSFALSWRRLTTETHTFDMSYCGQKRVYASTTD